jgi:hypothetical protein
MRTSPLQHLITRAPATAAQRPRTGGSRGNEVLTSINAVAVVALIALQLATLLALDSLIRVHLFVGVVLLGPIALKLASTGYRFVRYYTGASDYREQGPPPTVLRVIAPVFVLATIGVFGSGVAMLLDGESTGGRLDLHVTSVWVWLICLGVHIAFNVREVVRNVRGEWFSRARLRIAGAELRAGLVIASLLGGALVAIAMLSKITGFESG